MEKLNKKVDMIKTFEMEFLPIIKSRGEDYFNKGRVISCKKIKNKYKAEVLGSELYNVNITYDYNNNISYECDCPCNFPCKHIYATFLAIKNHKYKTIRLKKYIKPNKYTITSILKEVPADKIKEVVINNIDNGNLWLSKEKFEESFIEYLPRNSYWYYYNNLYNALMLQDNPLVLISIYQNKINSYIGANDYSSSFMIIKAIIEALHDTNNFDTETFMHTFFSLGIAFNIIYKRADKSLKEEIDLWIEKVSKNKFYNNICLESIIINLK